MIDDLLDGLGEAAVAVVGGAVELAGEVAGGVLEGAVDLAADMFGGGDAATPAGEDEESKKKAEGLG